MRAAVRALGQTDGDGGRSAPAFAERLARAGDALVRGLQLALGGLLLLMTAINVLNAALRYLAGFQFRGSDELLAFGQVWLVMVGVALAAIGRRHLAVDLLGGLTGRAGQLRRLGIDLVTLVVCLYCAHASWSFVARMWSFGATSMGLAAPMWLPHAAVLTGFVATAGVAAALSVVDLLALAHRRPAARDGDGDGGARP